jgi:hypothetical protein
MKILVGKWDEIRTLGNRIFYRLARKRVNGLVMFTSDRMGEDVVSHLTVNHIKPDLHNGRDHR